MKANELRIGNLVNYKYWNPEPNNEQYLFKEVKIVAFFKDRFYFNFKGRNEIEKVDELNPIPLTEEWLVKFGFEKEKGKPTTSHGNYYSISILDCKYSFSFSDFREDWGFYHSYTDAPEERDNNKYDFISCGIKSVHQLQNFYFALTGEELTIKE